MEQREYEPLSFIRVLIIVFFSASSVCLKSLLWKDSFRFQRVLRTILDCCRIISKFFKKIHECNNLVSFKGNNEYTFKHKEISFF